MRLKSNLIVLIGICLISFYLRSTALYNDHFHNEDAAGILYSADLLLKGGLPQVDTVDMKAPGSFYLVAFWWKLFGRSMWQTQLLAIIWSILSTLGIGFSLWTLYGQKQYQSFQIPIRFLSIIGMLIYTLFSPNTDSMDINYNSWMITPYIWSFAFMLYAIQLIRKAEEPSQENPSQEKPSQDHRISLQSIYAPILWIVLSGLFLVWGALMKHQGSFLLPAFLFYLYHQPYRYLLILSLGFGMGLGFLPLFVHYYQHGHLIVILKNYFLSESGWRYVKEQQLWSDRFLGLYDGLLGVFLFTGFVAILSVLSIILYMRVYKTLQAKSHQDLIFLIILSIMSFGGVAVGWRFFKGYYLQLFAPLILVALHPITLRWLWDQIRNFTQFKIPQKSMIILLIMVLCTSFAYESKSLIAQRKQRRGPLHLPAVQSKQVGLWIKKNSKPEDQIWVWGRWAWPVYFYSQKMSATRYFKNLGVLTTQLTNTWRRGTKPTKFDPNTPWASAISELQAFSPKWIAIAQNESFQDFKAFKELLRQKYQKRTPQQIGLKGKQFTIDLYERVDPPKNPKVDPPKDQNLKK